MGQLKQRLEESGVELFFLPSSVGVIEHVVSGRFGVLVFSGAMSPGSQEKGSGSADAIVYTDGFQMLAKGSSQTPGAPARNQEAVQRYLEYLENMDLLCNNLENGLGARNCAVFKLISTQGGASSSN